MVAARYVPDKGDIVWLDFDPQVGHEQAGRRPALVLSPAAYNRRTGLGVFCPITSRIKGYPFEVVLPSNGAGVGSVTGVVLSDQVKNLDWQARGVRFAHRTAPWVTGEVVEKMNTLLQ